MLLLAVCGLALAESLLLGDVDPSVVVGENVTVQAGAVVAAGAVLEDGVFIAARAQIGENTRIGRDSVVGREAVILNDVIIPTDSLISRAAFIGANSHFVEQLTVGYGAVVGGGVRMTALTAGALSVLGGEAPDGEVTIDCPVLTMARASRVAVQAPYTLKCDDPDNRGVILGPEVDVEPGVTFGAGVRIRKQAHIGQRAVIDANVRIARGACLGDSTLVADGSKVGARSRTGQDSQLGTGAHLARSTDLGGSAGECGVWPDGEPSAPSGFSEAGYPLFPGTGEVDTDPGSQPGLWVETQSLGVCGGNDVMFYALDDNTSNSGAFQDTSLRELDLVTGAEVVIHARTPEIRSIAVSADGTHVFTGYGFASTSARPEVLARRFQVFETNLLTSVETSLVNTTIAGSQRRGLGIGVTDTTVTVLAAQGSYNSSNSSAILSIDRQTGAVGIERRLELGRSHDMFLVSPGGAQHWFSNGVATRLEPDGSLTTFDVADPSDAFNLVDGAFGPDGTLYLAETGDFDFDDEGNFFVAAQIRAVDLETGASSIFTETVNGDSFYPTHIDVDCDGDVWIGSQDVFGDGGSTIHEISADGSVTTLRLTNAANSFEVGVFALAPE